MPDRMPERMSEDMPDRMPEQLTEDVPDKKCQCVDRCMVGCLRTRKSTSGYCVRLGGSTTKTSCKSQAAIALSSGEAEYYLLVSAACGALGEQSALKVGHLATNPVLDGFQYGMSHCIAAWVRPRQACGHCLFVGPRCSLQWSDRIGKETHDWHVVWPLDEGHGSSQNTDVTGTDELVPFLLRSTSLSTKLNFWKEGLEPSRQKPYKNSGT